MEENNITAPAAENTEKKLSSGKASIVLVLLALAIGFVAGRYGAILLPQKEKMETIVTYRNTESRYYAEEGGEPVSVSHSEFDEAGRLLTMSDLQPDGSMSVSMEYVYDENGQVLSMTQYNVGGSVSWRTEYTYDENGNQLTACEYGEGSEFMSKSENVYDENGDVIEYISYDLDGTVLSDTVYASGKNADGTEYSETVEYAADGTVNSRSINTTDKNGNMAKSVVTDRDGSVQIWEYDYAPFEITVPADWVE